MSKHPHADTWFQPHRVRDARLIEVLAVEYTRGAGCCEKDPVRIVYSYYAPDGTLLAERDSFDGQRWENDVIKETE